MKYFFFIEKSVHWQTCATNVNVNLIYIVLLEKKNSSSPFLHSSFIHNIFFLHSIVICYILHNNILYSVANSK